VTQLVESSKLEALSSNPVLSKNKTKIAKKEGKKGREKKRK
jgi:hypothetical protein